MDKQIHIYSVDTSAFYNDEEMKIHKKLNRLYRFRKNLKKNEQDSKTKKKQKNEMTKRLAILINNYKEQLSSLLLLNAKTRKLRKEELNDRNVISVFESSLTRTLQIPEGSVSEEFIVVQTYYFQVLKDIILNGFIHNNEKYICFTASAGQIRSKKTIFIRENAYRNHQNSLTCGLTIKRINDQGGVNINKYLAYLALCNSATDVWSDFNIDKVIVVNDIETNVEASVDFINDETYEITRRTMSIPINHTDGCGMILPKKSRKSMMIRMPWVKGLLVPFPFDNFIHKMNNKHNNKEYGIVTDIYGKKYDIIKDGIEIILTKSQFKMWKYYSSWEEYKGCFKKYKCQAAKCNEEEDDIGDAKLNYQMLQTLTDITDKEIKNLSLQTNNRIAELSKDRKTMLRVLGVTDTNKQKNYLQQAIEVYPELLKDTYSKEILKQVKKSMVKDARSGKIGVNGKYTFICPDLYAFCEYLVLDSKNPEGLLRNGQVYCNLYKHDNKLNCLRSPHLYREHAIRENVVDAEKSEWFITKGLYTSIHDPISKILMMDVDGDKSLVCADQNLIKIAERNMRDIVPLYYNMRNAESEIISKENICKGLINAYTGGNIGMISNDITKIWNSENISLDAIKWLCMENNFVIDYAKTLYKPTRPEKVKKHIADYIKLKTPYFFRYAKNKKVNRVEKANKSTMNRLTKAISNPRLKFSCIGLDEFDYKMLMSGENKNVDLNRRIIDRYDELDLKSHFIINRQDDSSNFTYVYQNIRQHLLEVHSDINYVTDILVEYLYKYREANFKTTLWESFGDVLVNNLKKNMVKKFGEDYKRCRDCRIIVEKNNNRKKYCSDCWKDRERNIKREWKRKYDKSRSLENPENP